MNKQGIYLKKANLTGKGSTPESKNKSDNQEKINISLVIPVYNEEENISHLYSSLSSVLEKLGRSYEVILIDDGSSDNSYEKLAEIHNKNKKFKVIRFRRNFGQTQAMRAGFDTARGKS